MPAIPPVRRALSLRNVVVLTLGIVMMAMGSYVALRPLWAGPRPLTDARWLDMAVAAFFLLRGWMNVRTALNARREAPGA